MILRDLEVRRSATINIRAKRESDTTKLQSRRRRNKPQIYGNKVSVREAFNKTIENISKIRGTKMKTVEKRREP